MICTAPCKRHWMHPAVMTDEQAADRSPESPGSNHRQLDGTIVEVDGYFTIDGKKSKYPGGFGNAAEDCSCRCVALTRAKWALDQEELDTMQQCAEAQHCQKD